MLVILTYRKVKNLSLVQTSPKYKLQKVKENTAKNQINTDNCKNT